MKTEQKRVLQFIFGVCILVGVAGLLWLTQWGAGLFDWDSFNYLASARSFAAGQGFQIPYSSQAVRPMTHYPPFFPAVLGSFVFFGLDPMQVARWLNIGLYGVNMVLFGVLAWRMTHNRWLTGLAALLFLFSADLALTHAWVLSEPLLITLVLGAMSFADINVSEGKRWGLWLALMCVGLAVLTKFVGAAVSAVLGLSALFYLPTWRTRLQRFSGYALAGLLPIMLWSWRSYALTQTFNNRGLVVTPIHTGNLLTAFFTFYTWLFPQRWLLGNERTFLMLSVMMIFGVALALFKVRRGRDKQAVPYLVSVQLGFGGIYFVLVFLAKMFFDPGIGFQARMFIPLYPSLLLLLIWVISQFVASEVRWAKMLAGGLAAYFLLSTAITSVDTLPAVAAEGLGWNRRVIVTAAPLLALQDILAAEDIELYSNELFGTYFHTGLAVPRFATFPPVVVDKPVYVLLYNERINGQHALPDKHPNEMILIAADDVFALYAYLPE